MMSGSKKGSLSFGPSAYEQYDGNPRFLACPCYGAAVGPPFYGKISLPIYHPGGSLGRLLLTVGDIMHKGMKIAGAV